jgi:hypothetical protein
VCLRVLPRAGGGERGGERERERERERPERERERENREREREKKSFIERIILI